MPKTRDQKKKIIDQLADNLKKSELVVLADYQGIDNPALQKLREQLKEGSAKFQIVKNALFQIALNKAELKIDEKLMDKPIAIALSKDINSAKVLKEFGKEEENLEILGGIYQAKYQDNSFIEKLASIPTRDELLTQLVGQLKAPQSGLVYALKGNLLKLMYILKQKAQAN